jgi:hypothetical protein
MAVEIHHISAERILQQLSARKVIEDSDEMSLALYVVVT